MCFSASVRTQNVFRWLFTSINTLVTLYLSVVHQSGSIFAAHYINFRLKANLSENSSILLLTPCFTLPGRTHLHVPNLTIRSLGCLPNFDQKSDYQTESELFREDPVDWIESNLNQTEPLVQYSFIVMFDYLQEVVEHILDREGFRLDQKFHYSHFPDRSAGQSRRILVFASPNT